MLMLILNVRGHLLAARLAERADGTHTHTHTQVSLMLLGWLEGHMGTLCHYGGLAIACGGGHIVIERTLTGSGVQRRTLNVVGTPLGRVCINIF